jgi:hypothetical protein
MEAVTWIDRITDETNPWLVANKKEDENDYARAIVLYLEDATECLRQNQVVKAALSSSCAAECLAKTGKHRDANLLYSETARIYLANADSVITTSVRESLWSLREAYEYFLLAKDLTGARQVHYRLMYLAKRVDPNSGDLGIALELPRGPAQTTGNGGKEELPLESSDGVAASIGQFMTMRRSQAGPVDRSTPHPAARTDKRRRQAQDEKSIIGQLG